MSTPEETRTDSAAAAAPSPATDVGQAVAQLRGLVCGLGLALLVLSLVFDAFVFKQNRNVQGETAFRTRQAAQMQAMEQRLMPALNDLARYSTANPEAMAIFKRHGLELTPPASSETQSLPLQP